MKLDVNYYSKCCGLKELNGLSFYTEPDQALKDLCDALYPADNAECERRFIKARKYATDMGVKTDDKTLEATYAAAYFMTGKGAFHDINQYSRFRYLTFSEAQSKNAKPNENGYGSTFAALLTKLNVGQVISTGWNLNPNSSNNLKVWVWTIDHDVLRKWWGKNRPKASKVTSAPPDAQAIMGGAPQQGAAIYAPGAAQAPQQAYQPPPGNIGQRLRNAARNLARER
jgi:hypothetical protein